MSILSRAAFAAGVLVGTSFRTATLSVRATSSLAHNHVLLTAHDHLLKMNSFEQRRKLAQEKVKSEKSEILMQIAEQLQSGDLVDARVVQELIFVAEPEDLELVLAAARKVEIQTSKLRFNSFKYDSSLMRLLYFLNEPKAAFDTFKDPVFKYGRMDYTTVVILLHLLFNNAMYSEIIDCVDTLKSMQSWYVWSAPIVSRLFAVSCLKLNTQEALSKAVLYVEKCGEHRHPSAAALLTAGYSAVCTNPSKAGYFLQSIREAGEELKFNISLQLLLKEDKLVLVLDMLENCPHRLTKDTVDKILEAVGREAASDLKSFIKEYIKVNEKALSDCLIEFVLSYEVRGEQDELSKLQKSETKESIEVC